MRWMLIVLCASLVLNTAQAQTSEAEPQTGLMKTDASRDQARQEVQTDTGWMYHLRSYGADWAAISALLIADAAVLPLLSPGPALLGPRFDDGRPDFVALSAPELDRQIGAPYRENTVPSLALYLGGGLLAGSALGYDTLAHGDAHRVHNLLLGGLEAVVLTYTLTEALKLGVGRLRPDFRDRATRYYCNPDGGAQRGLPGLDCSGVDADGGYLEAKDLRKGHRSFPSGHASASFALATYFALYVGGEMVWGTDATVATRGAGAAMMAGLWGLAGWVAATRVSDGRHHIDDVAAGAAIGAAASALFYFLHFDLDGRATYRGLSVAPSATPGGGLALSLALPL